MAKYTAIQAARLCGISKSTLLAYEKEELITPTRNDRHHREYSDEDIERIKQIKQEKIQKLLTPR